MNAYLSLSVSSLIGRKTNNNEHYNNRSFCPYWITDLCLGLRHAMKAETLLDPIDMTEELMFHIFNNDMNRELDGRWLDLYVSLQLYKEHLEKLENE